MRIGPIPAPETRGVQLALALAVAAVVSALLTRSITRPVADLERATRALAGGRLDARVAAVTASRRDELGALGNAFDTMAQQLSQLVSAREDLLRDVSHELRSPLARMRLALGLAQQPGGDVSRQLERIGAEIERLDRLLGDILDVSRLGAGSDALRAETLDLAAIIDRVVADARYEGQAGSKEVAWTLPADAVPVLGDPHWLAAAIENLVRNALRYTPPHARVDVQVASSGPWWVVTVADSGPGVAPEALQRIFEPFYRTAAARERESGGTGLGLAIVERVMRAHGGRAVARQRGDATTGLEVALYLPRSVSASS